jgi:hypothetical protein
MEMLSFETQRAFLHFTTLTSGNAKGRAWFSIKASASSALAQIGFADISEATLLARLRSTSETPRPL